MRKSIQNPTIAAADNASRVRDPTGISRTRRVVILGTFCAVVLCLFLTSSQQQPTQAEYQYHQRRQLHDHRLDASQAEKVFLSVPDAQSALAASRAYGRHPHLAGSPADFSDAKVLLKLFQDELGIRPPREEPIFRAGTQQSRRATLQLTDKLGPARPTAWIDTYFPILDTAVDQRLEIVEEDGTVAWDADLVEDGNPLDEDAAKYRDAVPTWHGVSFNGSATGEFIYANYGTQADYKELLAKGVNFTGKIVLTRYGGIFRGSKVKGADQLGAAGVIVYSDPRDDGVVTEENGYKPYPHGPARNPTSVQRGSVSDISFYQGDPTTPGYPAYEDAPRQKAATIPRIPSLPISWQNAQVLLKELGSEDPRQLNGRVSERKVRIVNHVNTKITPIWNAVGSIPGHIRDEVVVIGCHRDAWGLGATDPVSGTVSLREIVRGFGKLLKKGWKPLRTIIVASWDAEEYALVGSTEWGEDFEQWISAHVVAYLNIDISTSGSQWSPLGSPLLAHLLKGAALDIPHPTSPNRTLWDARDDEGPYKANATLSASVIDPDVLDLHQKARAQREALDTGVAPLGSGSDYTVFLQRIGVPSTHEDFSDTLSDAVYHYHSIYDTQRWQELYGDPTFERHVAVAKHVGLVGLRLTDSIILPLNTTQYAFELDKYVDRVIALTVGDIKPDFSGLRRAIGRLQKSSLALDKEKEEAEAKFKEEFRKLHQRNAQERRDWNSGRLRRYLKRQADRVLRLFGIERRSSDQGLCGRLADPGAVLEFSGTIDDESSKDLDVHQCSFPILESIKAAKRVRRANQKLIAFERGFISKEGIEGREWYRHLGVAPGKWLGYGATTLPGLTEAVEEEKSIEKVQHEIGRLVGLFNNLSKKIAP